MIKMLTFTFFIFCTIIVTSIAEDNLMEKLPLEVNQTKLLAKYVCSDLFPDDFTPDLLRCQKNFLISNRNVTRRPPELWIKCRRPKSLTFMITPSENYQLVVPVPQENDPTYVDYILVERFTKFDKIFASRNLTLWTVMLNDDGSLSSLWQKGPKVEEWKISKPRKYDITVNILTHRYKKGSQIIDAEIKWNTIDDSDNCFDVINSCNKDIPGNSFQASLQPDNNRTVVVSALPLGDECIFMLKGKYGETKLEYKTPECLDIQGCAPLPEEFKNVTIEISKSPSGLGWNVCVHWEKPRVTPTHYNATLFASTNYYNLILPGNATEALFEEITEEGLFYVTLTAATASGTAYTTHERYLSPLEPSFPTLTVGLLVGAAWLIALLLVLAATAFVYCKERRSEKVKFDYLQHFHTKDLDEKLCKEGVLEALKQELTEDRWEVRGSRLTLHEVVGEGAFGLVRRATLAPGKQVAVKMLKNFPTADEVRSFRAEMELMKSVGAHPHVVSLVGCCSGRRPLIIAEYCSLGDLLTFLRCSWDVMLSKRNAKYNNKGTLEYRSGVLRDTGGSQTRAVTNKLYDLQGACEELTFPDLLSFCRQIAMGMEFLASNRVVHRDLAARNVLVASDRTLKIADFGLSRDVYQENQYKQKGNGKMPVKWMALESLTHRIFTTQSDVWSFGVVMWEVVTVGGAPYPAVAATRLPRLLRAGYRMPRPPNCTTQLYEVMTSCWRTRPCERPTFAQLHARLDALLAAACADSYLTLDLPVDLPTLPSLPSLPQLTHNLLKGKGVWERGENYERPNALSNHYTSPPVTSAS